MEDIRFTEEFMMISEGVDGNQLAYIYYLDPETGHAKRGVSKLKDVKIIESGQPGKGFSPYFTWISRSGKKMVKAAAIFRISVWDKTLIRHYWGLELQVRTPIFDDNNEMRGVSSVKRIFSGWASS